MFCLFNNNNNNNNNNKFVERHSAVASEALAEQLANEMLTITLREVKIYFLIFYFMTYIFIIKRTKSTDKKESKKIVTGFTMTL